MRSILSVLFSVIIFTASFQNSLFLIDYQINRDFYEIHCMNREKPELQCHGKCQIKKESEKSALSLVKYSFEFNILPGKSFDFTLKTARLFIFKANPPSFHTPFAQDPFLQILPHPPQFSI